MLQSLPLLKSLTAKELIALRPSWVKNAIHGTEAQKITAKIIKMKAETAIEVGVASGFSSAVIFNALASNTRQPKLYSFDLSTECYFDPSRKSGDALLEMLGYQPGFQLRTGFTSADINSSMVDGPVDFVLIDASHKTPWPAFDLLSIGRFIKQGTQIALHDTNMIFKKDTWRYNNGPRDVYRAWLGRKHRFKNIENMGFLVYDGDPSALLLSVAGAIACDWDERVDPTLLAKFADIAKQYEADSRVKEHLIQILTLKAESWRHKKLV